MKNIDNVIQMSSYVDSWKEIFQSFSDHSDLHVYADQRNKSLDLTLINDEGESITSRLTSEDSLTLYNCLKSMFEQSNKTIKK